MPQPFDLTDVATLIEYANLLQPSAEIQDIAQEAISGFSAAVYRYTGRTTPMFSAVTSFDEVYDGNDGDILYTINSPLVTVTSVQVNGATVPQSTGVFNPGWFIDQAKGSIKMRSNSGAQGVATFANTDWATFTGLPPYRFLRGRGNIEIVYTAGYAVVPDDLILAALKQCTVYLNRRLREDEQSRMIPNAGSTTYGRWSWSPDVFQLVNQFKRIAAYNAAY